MAFKEIVLCIAVVSLVNGAPYMYPRHFNPSDYWAYWNFRGPYIDSTYHPMNHLYGYGYDYTVYNDDVIPNRLRYANREHQYESKLRYYGKLEGSCEEADDGLYYMDEYSFAFCTSGQLTLQPCADGAANPPLETFTSGRYYGFNDFCSVNLLAKGYRPRGASQHEDRNQRRSEPNVHVYRDHQEYVYMPNKELSSFDRGSPEHYEYRPSEERFGIFDPHFERDIKSRVFEETVGDQSYYRPPSNRRFGFDNGYESNSEGSLKEERKEKVEKERKYPTTEHEYEKHYIVEAMGHDKRYKQPLKG